jgi:two-component system, cell cycle sensor histidine kinase and response regulator CckA
MLFWRGVSPRAAHLPRMTRLAVPLEAGRNAWTGFSGKPEKMDLLLTDVVMPEMNSKVLFEPVTARFPGTRVLFMSGYAEDVIARRGVLEEGIYYIQKPFSVQALSEKVREALGQKTVFTVVAVFTGKIYPRRSNIRLLSCK